MQDSDLTLLHEPAVQQQYREVLTFVDWFMALRFSATSAPLAVRDIQILLMNQYAGRSIAFGLK
jgi:hypothetical protein